MPVYGPISKSSSDRHQPVVLRGCAAQDSPAALEWTDAYLSRVAGDHTAPFCEDPLGEWLAGESRGRFATRNCAQLPAHPR